VLDDGNIDSTIQWNYDPKKLTPGVFVLGSSGPFERSESVSAVLWSNRFYIVINSEY